MKEFCISLLLVMLSVLLVLALPADVSAYLILFVCGWQVAGWATKTATWFVNRYWRG